MSQLEIDGIIDTKSKLGRYIEDLRVAVVGSVDAGKSSLIGVLTSGNLDDGRGSARSKVFSCKHESDSGRTSTISHHIVGINDKTEFVHENTMNSDPVKKKNKSWRTLMHNTERTITFVDLAGHEKYVRTTMLGLSGTFPDIAMVVINANTGVSKMTKEHLTIVNSLRIPFVIVVTKIDMVSNHILSMCMKGIHKLLRSIKGCKYINIDKQDDIKTYIESNRAFIISISSVIGTNLDHLKLFLASYKPQRSDSVDIKGTEVHIDAAWDVTGYGLTLSGFVRSGTVTENDILFLGPFTNGTFEEVMIKTVYTKRTPTKSVSKQSTCSVSIKPVNRKKVISKTDIRSGMVLVDVKNPQSYRNFKAKVYILHHATTINPKYQPVIHITGIKQAARIKSLIDTPRKEDSLRSGDKSTVEFEFEYRPEYIHVGERFIFTEGSTKGIGIVSELIK